MQKKSSSQSPAYLASGLVAFKNFKSDIPQFYLKSTLQGDISYSRYYTKLTLRIVVYKRVIVAIYSLYRYFLSV